jgi:hypothetical protein
MLPFFVIGIAIPVYYFGWSGDQGVAASPSYSSPASDSSSAMRVRPSHEVVTASRDLFERTADAWGPQGFSRFSIKMFLLGGLFALGFVVFRLILAVISGFEGAAKAAAGFVVHKALGPMFMGFMAVGSTWGIHQTVAEQFGMTWAAVTVAMTAAVATLFALAGVRLRA